jgi:hypothetical protein
MTVGKNVKVNGSLIYSKILESYKNIYCFCQKYGIRYQTIVNIITGRTKALRAETLIQIAGFLECCPQEFMLEPLPQKEKRLKKNFKNLISALEHSKRISSKHPKIKDYDDENFVRWALEEHGVVVN